MSKIDVQISHENGGTIARVKMDAVPRVGDQVSIFKGPTVPFRFIVRKVSWMVIGKTTGVLISVADLPPSEYPKRVSRARASRDYFKEP